MTARPLLRLALRLQGALLLRPEVARRQLLLQRPAVALGLLQLLAQARLARIGGIEHGAGADDLGEDPAAVEKIAREDLGYAKPGETVFRFVDEEAP